MMEEAVAFKQYMYGIYKFEMHHLNTMNDMLKKVDELREEYEQYKAKLKRNKEKLFTEKNYSKWGLNTAQLERLNQSKGNQTKEECIAMMLPQETEMQMNMRDQYALMNAALYLEMIRYTKDNPHYLTRAILELSKKQAAASSAVILYRNQENDAVGRHPDSLWQPVVTNQIGQFRQNRCLGGSSRDGGSGSDASCAIASLINIFLLDNSPINILQNQ